MENIGDLLPDAAYDATDRENARPGAATLLIACGAVARELMAVVRASAFSGIAVTCLPAILHNRPERIASAIREKIRTARGRYHRILCLYGDCGTGGELDRVLAEEGVERIEGPHCYAFFAGSDAFETLMDEEPGTFFLTDYLARHFNRLVVTGLGLDRHPELLPVYFGHYRRVVHLVQVPDPATAEKARAAADRLGLAFESRWTGLGGLSRFVERAAQAQTVPA